LYAYVGNDPVNFVDPTGLTKSHRGRWVSCPNNSPHMDKCREFCKDRGGVKSCWRWRTYVTMIGRVQIRYADEPACKCNCDPEGSPQPKPQETSETDSQPLPKINPDLIKILPGILPWLIRPPVPE